MERIKVVLIETGQKPKLVELEHTLENLQEMVGGHIEDIRFSRKLLEMGVAVLGDEEGRLKNKIPTAILFNKEESMVLVGNIVILGCNEDNFCGLTEEQIEELGTNILRYGEYEVEVKNDEESFGVVELTSIYG